MRKDGHTSYFRSFECLGTRRGPSDSWRGASAKLYIILLDWLPVAGLTSVGSPTVSRDREAATWLTSGPAQAASVVALKKPRMRKRSHMIRSHFAPVCFVAVLGFLASSPSSRAQEPNQPQQPMVYEGTVGGLRVIEEGQPPVMIHATA